MRIDLLKFTNLVPIGHPLAVANVCICEVRASEGCDLQCLCSIVCIKTLGIVYNGTRLHLNEDLYSRLELPLTDDVSILICDLVNFGRSIRKLLIVRI